MIGTIITGLLLLAVVASIIVKMAQNKRKGKCTGCAGCGSAGCHL